MTVLYCNSAKSRDSVNILKLPPTYIYSILYFRLHILHYFVNDISYYILHCISKCFHSVWPSDGYWCSWNTHLFVLLQYMLSWRTICWFHFTVNTMGMDRLNILLCYVCLISLLSKCHTILQYIYICYFIHTHEVNMVPVLIFMKLKNAKQLGMQINYSEYHLNLLIMQNVWVEIHLCS